MSMLGAEPAKTAERPELNTRTSQARPKQPGILSRTVTAVAIMLFLTFGAIAISVLLGTTAQDISALLHSGATGESEKTWAILVEYRIPRALLAAVVGAGLAISGAVFQGVTRNPLADPLPDGHCLGSSPRSGHFAHTLRRASIPRDPHWPHSSAVWCR